MSTPINDGGPAFPGGYPVAGSPIDTPAPTGMTLRDWFAGQALAGHLARYSSVGIGSYENAAVIAFKLADAMLRAREGKV